MSMFASRSIDTIPIPFAPEQTATLRILTGRELDTAQGEHLRATIAGRWAAHGWAAAFQRQLKAGTATDADAEQLIADPLNGYDRHAIVKAGLLAWTIPDPALSPEAIEDLEDDALEWFAVEILKRTKPRLFQTADEAETARKNAPRPSSMA